MSVITRAGSTLAIGLCASLICASAQADVLVIEPSISLDQRIDDNYFLIPAGAGSLGATRAIGELGLSRQSETLVFRGLARVDSLLTTNTDVGDEDLNSNYIVAIDATRRSARSRFGIKGNYKLDTPSRDIAADISDKESLAEDTGLLVTQSLSSNVARTERTFEPSFEYDITRRLLFDAEATISSVKHDLPSAQDAIYQRYLDTFPRNEDNSFDGELLPYNAVTVDDVGVFSPDGELDNYKENEFELGLRYKLTPISTLGFSAGYSRFTARVEPDPAAIIPFDELIPDSLVGEIRRKPRRKLEARTATFKLNYDRFLTPTLQLAIDGGVYTNTTDTSDTLRAEDLPEGVDLPVGEIETDGWLASINLAYDVGATRYEGRYAVDVKPSSSGTQVETNELTGKMERVLSPRLDFSFRARAFEPDRLGARQQDRFARRFISFEPRIQWKYSRNWTVSAAFRYRRQKARIDPVAAESNAILLAIKYTPPSEIRDAARANGL
ncbi:MAG: hypothetical protein AB8B87_25780 [Granulosicoccus sp.]